MKANAKELCERHDSLKSRRATFDSLWQSLANYIMPSRANITEDVINPDTTKHDQLHDTTIVQANITLASGQLAWMTPMEEPWFSFDLPPNLRDDDEAKQWFQACTQIAIEELASSNFYTQIHEMYLDRGCFGTACLFVEDGKDEKLAFQKHDVGTFSIAENDEGYIDTVFREFELSARAAMQKFGEEALSKELRLKAKNPKNKDELVKFIHAIYPRAEDDREKGKIDAENKPVASVYLESKTKTVVQEGGYDEMPSLVTRFMRWGKFPYGISPGVVALADARQLNFLEKHLDVLAELAAFPRMLVPDNMEDDVDYAAAGVTYFNAANPNAVPREWATQGRYDVGAERSNHKRKSINEVFHVDLFKMFSQIEKEMTAREVSERAAEKIIQFSSTFSRMTTELFNPLLKRVFGLLIRREAFPPPPESVIIGDGVPVPKLSYSSKIALAVKSLANTAWVRTMETTLPLADRRPEVLDNFDFDRITRDSARHDGLPPDWMLPMAQVEELREERAAAAQQQAEAEQAQKLADAAQKVGTIPPENIEQLQAMAG